MCQVLVKEGKGGDIVDVRSVRDWFVIGIFN